MSKKWAWLILGLMALSTASVTTVLPYLVFDYEFDTFFNPDDETTVYYKNHREVFGTDNDFILVGIEPEASAFHPSFLAEIDSLTQTLQKGPFVKRVISPTNYKEAIKVPLVGGILQKPLFKDGRIDSASISVNPSAARQLFSTNLDAISLVIITEEKLSKAKCDSISNFINQSLDAYPKERVHVSGRAIGQAVYIGMIQSEFFLFMMISLVLIVGLLYLMFRNAIGIIVPLVIVFASILWTLAMIQFMGKGIGLLMTMIPPVIFVVGMSDAVHLYSRFIEELSSGKAVKDALRIMLRKTGLATLITSITTSIGFATLYFTGIPALQDFGIITALGVLITYIISILLLPALLVLIPKHGNKSIAANKNWDAFFKKLLAKVVKHKRAIRISTMVVVLALAYIGAGIKMNNFLLEDLKPGIKLKDDFDFFDKEFSGVRPFEIGIKSRDESSLINRASITEMEAISNYLKTEYGVNTVQSLVQIAYEINRTNHGGKAVHYALPTSQADWNTLLKDLKKIEKSGKLQPFLNTDQNYTRISGRVADLGGAVFTEKDIALKEFIADSSLNNHCDIALTGTGNLIDLTNQSLIFNLGKGLVIAFILIAILMGFLFKSLKKVFIALVPNLLPILGVAAAMALFGIDLKLTTGIIFTIAFGIAVDDTIHILSRYKLELRGGATKKEALEASVVHTGKALVITSLILFGGFLSLCFSSFQSTFYIGLLVTLTLFFALFFDLTLLPALLSDKDK